MLDRINTARPAIGRAVFLLIFAEERARGDHPGQATCVLPLSGVA
jgi:hypothetical protein